MMSQKIKSKKFITFFLILLFLIAGAFLFSQKLENFNVFAVGEGWLSGYAYRKPITITSYSVVQFTTVGTSSWTVPAGVTSVEYLVVGGGGGGAIGNYYGRAGGGGGGVVMGTKSVSGTVNVVVGSGGTAQGGNSVFGDVTALGGGNANAVCDGGTAGGSGSGGNSRCSGSSWPGGAATQTNSGGGTGYGNSGGSAYFIASGNNNAGGGGGAGAAGQNATASYSGAGGAGILSSITGVATYYGGGGGGLGNTGPSGAGGLGGGGASGVSGTNGLGGGGGALAGGGSGIVIIRYLTPALTDYQVKLTVPYVASKMKADFSDLRFTSSDGSTQLSYWIESYTASSSAVVWVKVPSLAVGANTIYIYYGNSSAVTASNIGTTFIREVSSVMGAWNLNETSGTAASDTSGNNKNGTVYNGAVWTAGKYYNALNFDGTNDYVGIGSLGSFYPQGTLEFWMNPTAMESYRNPIATKYLGGNAGIRFEEAASGSFVVAVGNDAASFTGHTYLGSGLAINTWYHVVLSWNTTSSIATGYLNNVLKFNEAQTLWPTTIPDMAIGNGFNTARYWKGLIDEVRIYNRVLTSDEVSDLYNNYGYTTASYPGKVLVRKYAAYEQTLSFGTEESLPAVCGSSNGANLYSAPTTNLCTVGTASAVSGSGPWTWNCIGSTTVGCSANLAVNGACGTSNGSSFDSAPTTNLCAVGTASVVVGSGPWSWSCAGVSGGGTPFCMANPTVGGSSSRSGLYTIEKFVGVGSTTWTVPAGVTSAEVLVVAGGGGGGMDMGGGGGGGGVIYNATYALTAGAKTLTVGAGGLGAPAARTNSQSNSHQYTIPATSGGNSVFNTLTAIGGGFGGSSYRGYTPGIAGGTGGSGGGASGYNDNAGTFLGGTGTAGQGNRGGNSTAAYYSGGGGGAGAAGADSTAQANGGAGYSCSILGTAYYWGGGGGGAGYSICGGNGGAGGGGGGAVCTTTGGSGLNAGSAGGGGSVNSQTNMPGGNGGPFTGGGGGGGSHYNWNNRGGNGGSGIVVIKYLTQYLTGWSYRKQITVNNTSGAVLNSYPIKFTVSYVSGKMNADFSDLRFTRLDGVNLLPYWIESKVNSSSAVVWVKVDSIPIAGNQIFMYYGNVSASSTSNFNNANAFSTTGLVEWLKVDSLTGITDGTAVATLTDSSGSGNSVTQATASRQPIYKTNILNGKPVLRFTAANQQTMTVATNFPAPVTVIYTGRVLGTANARMLTGLANNWLLGFWGGQKAKAYLEGWVTNYTTPAADTNWYIYSATIGGAGVNSSVYESGNIINSNQGGVTGPNGLSLSGANAASEFSDGEIAEVLVYNSILSIESRSIVERYLANKYALTYTPYYIDPTTTFGSEEFSGPVLAQVTAVPSSTTNPVSYTFNSTKAGTITYSGDCSSYTTSVAAGNSTITFNPLAAGTHSNCKIAVTDSLGIQSALLSVNSFTITYDTECASMATGGIISRNGSYCVHTFISNGTFDPVSDIIASVLVVAGGGGGGGDNGGGGGGGGVIYNSTYNVGASGVSATVGAGGAGSLVNVDSGTSGQNSVFGTITAIGGGRGASGQAGASLPLTGGSGGGGDGERSIAGAAGTTGQGNAGGTGLSGGAGGGGGAGAVGANSTGAGAAGAGGAGLANSITGVSTYYGGGGGGGNENGYIGGGAGGIGGGGTGNTGYGFSGVANSGGGGGGAGWDGFTATGGNGGSGVVVVRYYLTTGGLGMSSSNPGTDCNQIYIYNTKAHVSGVYWIKPNSTFTPFQVYCDMVTDGGGWTLIGKGREGWTWNNAGQGTTDDLALSPDSNTVSYLPATTVDAIIKRNINTLSGGVRIYRFGVNQDWRFNYPTMTTWDWGMSTSKTANVASRTPACTGTTSGNTNDTYWCDGVNACNRIFTWAWANHNSVMGWSAGSTCSCTGYGTDGWCYTTEGHVILRTQVWIKNPNPISSFLPTWKEISPF